VCDHGAKLHTVLVPALPVRGIPAMDADGEKSPSAVRAAQQTWMTAPDFDQLACWDMELDPASSRVLRAGSRARALGIKDGLMCAVATRNLARSPPLRARPGC
jgi:hypothetical protein